MASFPTFINAPSPQGLQPMGVQYKPLDFSPLLKSLALDKQIANAKKKTPTAKKEDRVKGRQGAVNQLYGNIAMAQSNIAHYEREYGTGASILPEYQKWVTLLNMYSSPGYINTVERETEEVKNNRSFLNTNKAGGNYNIKKFQDSRGGHLQTNEEAMTQQEHAPTYSMPNSEKFNPNPGYRYDNNFDLSTSIYTSEHVEDELDQMFGSANDQWNKEKLKSNGQLLNTIHSLSTTIARGAGGTVDVLKKGKYSVDSDLKTLSFANREAQERTLGGKLNLADPLVSGLYQMFIQQTGGGRTGYRYIGEDGKVKKRELLEDGEINENWYTSFQDFSSNYIKNHLNKRYNKKIEDELSYSTIAEGGSGKRTKSIAFMEKPAGSFVTGEVLDFVNKGPSPLDRNWVNSTNKTLESLGIDIYNQTKSKDDDYPGLFEEYMLSNKSTGVKLAEEHSIVNDMISEIEKFKNDRTGLYTSPLLESMKKGIIRNDDFVDPTTKQPFHINLMMPEQQEKVVREHLLAREGKLRKLNDEINANYGNQVQNNIQSQTQGFIKGTVIEYSLTDDLQQGTGIKKGDDPSVEFSNTNIQLTPGTNSTGAGLVGTIDYQSNRVFQKLKGEQRNWRFGEWEDKDTKQKLKGWNYFSDATGNVLSEPSIVSKPENGYLLGTWSPASLENSQAYAAKNWTNKNSPLQGTMANFVPVTMKVGLGDFDKFANMLNTYKTYSIDKDYGKEEVERTVDYIKKYKDIVKDVSDVKTISKVGNSLNLNKTKAEIAEKEANDLVQKGWSIQKDNAWGYTLIKSKGKPNDIGNKNITDKEFKKKWGVDRDEMLMLNNYIQDYDVNNILDEQGGFKVIPNDKISKIASDYIGMKYRNGGTDPLSMKRNAVAKSIGYGKDETTASTIHDALMAKNVNAWKDVMDMAAYSSMNIQPIWNEAGDAVIGLNYTTLVDYSANIWKQLDEEGQQFYIENDYANFNNSQRVKSKKKLSNQEVEDLQRLKNITIK